MPYSAIPATAALAMTLMGLGFHLRRMTKSTRKIASAVKSMLPKSAGNMRWPYKAMHSKEIPCLLYTSDAADD